jgi:hypothetical protein
VLYVVTGLGRCGTSMMMNALANGGMDIEHTPKGNDDWVDGYHPNRDGYFELTRDQLFSKGFPGMFDERLIKIPFGVLYSMKIVPMRVVFMMRDFDEVRASYKRVNDYRKGKRTGLRLETFIEDYDRIRDEIKGLSDDYVEIWYKDVLEKPLECFEIIKSHGFPIDPVKCAEIPEKGLCHF